MRMFIAVPLPAGPRQAVAALQAALARAQADVKWVEPANLHLTLKFLGDRPSEAVPAIREVLVGAAVRVPAFRMALRAVGAFPTLTAPRVIWVGVEEGRAVLESLAREIDAAGARLAWPAEERPWSAHLTIGRVRSPRGRAELAQAMQHVSWEPPAPWPVERITLFESVLSSSGPRYTALAEIPLAG